MFGRSGNKGIALVEALAAAVVLALIVSAISMISSRSIRMYREGQDLEQAWQMLDSQLTTISAMGPTGFQELGKTEGWAQLPGESDEKKYYWQVAIDDSDLDGLYDIEIIITYGKNRSISAKTKLYDASSAITTI